MKKIIPIILISIMIPSFAGAETIKVWPTEERGIIFKKFGPNIESVAPPYDFTITPADISEMCSPRKYTIIIYTDKIYYYVARYGATSKETKIYGIKVNGKTGEIIYPETKNKYSILYIKKHSVIK